MRTIISADATHGKEEQQRDRLSSLRRLRKEKKNDEANIRLNKQKRAKPPGCESLLRSPPFYLYALLPYDSCLSTETFKYPTEPNPPARKYHHSLSNESPPGRPAFIALEKKPNRLLLL